MTKAGVGAAAVVLLAVLIVFAVSAWSRQPAIARASVQPINFPHKAHVRASVKCQTCHGPVETMTTVAAITGPNLTNDMLNLVGFKPAAPPLTMGWCVECHREQNATRHTQAPLDCVTCHH